MRPSSRKNLDGELINQWICIKWVGRAMEKRQAGRRKHRILMDSSCSQSEAKGRRVTLEQKLMALRAREGDLRPETVAAGWLMAEGAARLGSCTD